MNGDEEGRDGFIPFVLDGGGDEIPIREKRELEKEDSGPTENGRIDGRDIDASTIETEDRCDCCAKEDGRSNECAVGQPRETAKHVTRCTSSRKLHVNVT